MTFEMPDRNYMKLLDWIPVDKFGWYCLSGNPNAIPILEKNFDKIDWDYLSQNPNAVHILEKNLDKVNWRALSQMLFIFWKKTWIK